MKVISFILLCLLFSFCKDENELTNEMIKQKLEERRTNFIQNKMEECNKELMKEIEELADSILIYQSKRTKYDSLTIPYDSIRPEKPELQFPEYKKPVKPDVIYNGKNK